MVLGSVGVEVTDPGQWTQISLKSTRSESGSRETKEGAPEQTGGRQGEAWRQHCPIQPAWGGVNEEHLQKAQCKHARISIHWS